MFQHHNPLINENDYNYFCRCVNRFKNVLIKKEHKLFLMFYPNIKDNYEYLIKDIIDFNANFQNYTTNYILLVIFHIPENKCQHTFTYHDNIHFLKLNTNSLSNGSYFINNEDNIYLDNIIHNNYKFNIIN